MKEYTYDIAISLCSEDAEFARALKAALNPRLKIFFYEDEQERLTGKSGVSEFASVFKSEARIVLILAREKYGVEGYTSHEQDAIHERLVEEKMNMSFILVIKMEDSHEPSWYPGVRIYANAKKQSIDEIVGIIEYKLTESGVEIIPLSFEDKVELSVQKENERKAHQLYLESRESVGIAQKELLKLIEGFNRKIKNPKTQELHTNVGFKPIVQHGSWRDGIGNLAIDKFQLQLAISELHLHSDQLNSQYVTVDFGVYPNRTYIAGESADYRKEGSYKFNTDQKHLIGWSKVTLKKNRYSFQRKPYEFTSLNEYILGEIVTTDKLLDMWFSNLLEKVDL